MQRSGNDLERACVEQAAYQAACARHALVSLADRAGNIIRVNDLFCQISSHTRSDLVGHSHRLLQRACLGFLAWCAAYGQLAGLRGLTFRSRRRMA